MHWTRRIAKGAGDTGFFRSPLLWIALLMLALHLAGLRDALLLPTDSAITTQPWRLISAHFVHWSDWHLIMNVSGLAILPLLCDARWALSRWLLVLLALSLSVSAGILMLAPDIDRYAGFSGVLHGLFLLGLLPQARAGDRIAAVCLLYLVGKILLETFSGPLFADPERVGAAIAHQAHLAGALGAAGLLGIEALRRRLRRS